MNNEPEYGFNLQEWKMRELQKYNNRTNGRHIFRAKATSYTEQRLTLADGTVILTPEEGKWIGKPIMLENGTPLPPGEYTLANSMHSSGRIIVIDKNGNVAEVREPARERVIKNSSASMYEGRITAEEFKRRELAKLPANRQLAINQLSKKLAALQKEIPKPKEYKKPKTYDLLIKGLEELAEMAERGIVENPRRP